MSSITPEQTIRYVLGAVGTQAGILTDEEIENAILAYPLDWRLAAAHIADSLASRAVNSPDSFALQGVMNVSWGDRAAEWRRLAERYRKMVADEQEFNRPAGTMQSSLLKREAMKVEEEYSQPRSSRRGFRSGW